MKKVTQAQIDTYSKEKLQPLADSILANAQADNIPPVDFFLVCLNFTKKMLVDLDHPEALSTIELLEDIGSVLATEEVRSWAECECEA